MIVRPPVGVVAAHYPPNFVSGGALQPQRLALGLAQRGWDVHVLAGWVGRRRTPLQVWDDVEGALPVRWVNTGPYLGWSDERNFDNPRARDVVARWLAEVRPGVVHLHTLQGLGALVAPAARATGARVVLTMHDFWWVCARQFLVDRHYRPCSLVVAAGTCQCEVDRSWLEHRNAFLRRQLDVVDLVLAPSAVAAEVLVANGVDPERLAVDPNGLPNAESARAFDPEPGTVRFTYAGGSDAMKGAPVLLDAAQMLGGLRGWRLTAYGLDGDGDALPRVVRAPAFDPDDLDVVMTATDVVVVPSIMRETHSLVTREALARGVPVVCTECLGPEEVVVDGANGLVVPAADPVALAGALRRLATDQGLLDRLRAGTRSHPVRVRRVAEQLDGLEARIDELLAAPLAPPVERLPVTHVTFVVGIEGAPLRYRARLPAEALALAGVATDVAHYRDARVDGLIDATDVLIVYRVPMSRQLLALIERARRRAIPVLFDADDLIFDPELVDDVPGLRHLPADTVELWWQGVRRYRATLEACDGYIASTAVLAAEAARLTGLPTARFDNGVGVLLGRRSDDERARPRRPGPLRVGYFSGSDAHGDDWALIEPALVDILRGRRDVEVWLGGLLPASAALDGHRRVRRTGLVPWTSLPGVLRDLDVNLAPLRRGVRFNEAKSAVKWLEAALVETPTVASATDPFRDAIDDRTGVLIDDDARWVEAIGELLDDEALRSALGRRARQAALLRWSPHLQARRYLDVMRAARSWVDPLRARPGPAPDVTVDEPPVPVALEPYELAAHDDAHDPAAGSRTSLRSVLACLGRRGRGR